MNQQERKILFFTSGAHFFTHFYILMFPTLVMPLTRQLQLPLAEVVNIGFWMYMLYGMLALAWGWISDHWGHKYAMAAGMLVAGSALALAGFMNSRVGITLAFAAVGAGCSAYHPAGTALVSQGIRERGRALGITGIWGSVGMASVPFTVGFLTYTLGWQAALAILGSLGCLLGIGSLIVPFGVDRQKDRKVVQKLENQAAAKLFLILLVSMLFAGLMYRSFTVILPAFMESRLGGIGERISSGSLFGKDSEALKTLAANTLTTLIYVLAIAGQAVGGRVADRFSLFLLLLCRPALRAGPRISVGGSPGGLRRGLRVLHRGHAARGEQPDRLHNPAPLALRQLWGQVHPGFRSGLSGRSDGRPDRECLRAGSGYLAGGGLPAAGDRQQRAAAPRRPGA